MRFEAAIEESNGAGRWVRVPADVVASFGSRRPAVLAHVNGVAYRSRLSVYGGETYLGLRKELRDQLHAGVGDIVVIDLEVDDEPRVVEEPPELASVLASDVAARAAYDKLAFTHRKEYARWVGEAKQQATRDRRAAKAVDMLAAGRKTPDQP